MCCCMRDPHPVFPRDLAHLLRRRRMRCTRPRSSRCSRATCGNKCTDVVGEDVGFGSEGWRPLGSAGLRAPAGFVFLGEQAVVKYAVHVPMRQVQRDAMGGAWRRASALGWRRPAAACNSGTNIQLLVLPAARLSGRPWLHHVLRQKRQSTQVLIFFASATIRCLLIKP